MFGKKILVSLVALTAVCGAFGAVNRGGSLRVQPGTQNVKATSPATAVASVGTSSRLATLPGGVTNISTKPKNASSASAAMVADLKDKLDELASDVAALQGAGVDEGAVRDIINSELADKDYATHPELQEVDDKIAGISPTTEIQYDESTGDLQYKDSNGDWQTFANRSQFAGADGEAVELRKNETDGTIEWKKHSDTAWTKLVDLDDITGEAGVVDPDQLARAVESAVGSAVSVIDEKLLLKADKSDLSDYVAKSTYNMDKETMEGNIGNAQSAAGTAQAKAEEAKTLAQQAKAAADAKLGKDAADGYYVAKDDFNALGVRVQTAEGNIASLSENKADKSTTYTKAEVDSAIGAARPHIEIGYNSETNKLWYKDENGGTHDLEIEGLRGDDGCTSEFSTARNTDDNATILTISGCGDTRTITIPDGIKGDKGDKGDKGETGAQGLRGEDGSDACEPNYSSTFDENGNTVVTITCADDSTKVLGQYTVSKGADGANPCPGGLSLEEDTNYDQTDGVRYNIVCNESQNSK